MWVLSICLGSALLLVSLYAVFVHRRMIRFRRRLMYGNTNPEILAASFNYSKRESCPLCAAYIGREMYVKCGECNSMVSQLLNARIAYNGYRPPLIAEVSSWKHQQEKA